MAKPSNTVFLGYMQKGGKVSDFNGKEIGTYRVTSSRKTPNSHISDTQYILRVNLPGKGEFIGWSAGNSMAITGRQAVKKNPKRANKLKERIKRKLPKGYTLFGRKTKVSPMRKRVQRGLFRSDLRPGYKRMTGDLHHGGRMFSVNRGVKGKKVLIALFHLKRDAFQYARALHLSAPRWTITVASA